MTGAVVRYCLALLAITCLLPVAASANVDHDQWQQLLQRHVIANADGTATEVDYAGFAAERAQLKQYLDRLAQLTRKDFDTLPVLDQLAFLINAYNAWTVELILTRYPDLESIRDLGSLFRSPWRREFIPLLGQMLSLDDIEHGLIRGSGRYNEPRIHFAVNCASIGCPALSKSAYVGEKLEAQLEHAAIKFLQDRSRNRVDGDVLKVSSIFKWYRDDFETGWHGAKSLPEFFALYADALDLSSQQVRALRENKIKIKFLDYDWRLNELRKVSQFNQPL